MEAVSFLPNYIHIAGIPVSQTLLASLCGTAVFLWFVALYTYLKKNIHNKLVNLVDMGVEGIMQFFHDLWGDIPYSIIKLVVFIFIYIFWSNIFGLLGDLFVLVVPSLHSYFRPVSTDVFFNMILAVVCVVGSIVYGFKLHGKHYIEKYVGYKWLGIVDKVTGVWSFLGKIFDIIIGLFLGIIEFVGELAKILSLSLRLFGNILAGMVLLGLIMAVTQSLFHVPAILPLVVIVFELFVGFLQAFVFAMLVLVYFKIAREH